MNEPNAQSPKAKVGCPQPTAHSPMMDQGRNQGRGAPDLSVTIAGVCFKTPVTTASGTFGYGREYAPFVDLNRLGAITVKGITLEPRQGNPGQRLIETPAGMINSVGLMNPGVEH